MSDEVAKPKADEASRPYGGAPETQQGAKYNYFESVQNTYQQMNVNRGLQFPSVEQIHAIEKYMPGFSERVVAMMQNEAANRHEMMRQCLHDEFEEKKNLEALKHEFYMDELKREDGRINMITLPIILLILAFGVTAIVFFAKGNNTAALTCVGFCSIPSVATLVQSVKTGKKK